MIREFKSNKEKEPHYRDPCILVSETHVAQIFRFIRLKISYYTLLQIYAFLCITLLDHLSCK